MLRNPQTAPVANVDEEVPAHVNPILWQQSLGLARQIASRVFRDGGRASDALAALGLRAPDEISWDKAVEAIASELARGRSVSRLAA